MTAQPYGNVRVNDMAWSRLCVCVCLSVCQAQAVFAQQATIPASRCEPQYQNLPDPTRPGKTIQEFTFNKGL